MPNAGTTISAGTLAAYGASDAGYQADREARGRVALEPVSGGSSAPAERGAGFSYGELGESLGDIINPFAETGEQFFRQRVRTTTSIFENRWANSVTSPDDLITRTYQGGYTSVDTERSVLNAREIDGDQLRIDLEETTTSKTNPISDFSETERRTTITTEQARSPGLSNAFKYLGAVGDSLQAVGTLVDNLSDPVKRQDAARVAAEFTYDLATGLGAGAVGGTVGGLTTVGVTAATSFTGPAAPFIGVTSGIAAGVYVDNKLGDVADYYRNDAVGYITTAFEKVGTAVNAGRELVDSANRWRYRRGMQY